VQRQRSDVGVNNSTALTLNKHAYELKVTVSTMFWSGKACLNCVVYVIPSVQFAPLINGPDLRPESPIKPKAVLIPTLRVFPPARVLFSEIVNVVKTPFTGPLRCQVQFFSTPALKLGSTHDPFHALYAPVNPETASILVSGRTALLQQVLPFSQIQHSGEPSPHVGGHFGLPLGKMIGPAITRGTPRRAT
jgi:hypothetical protein